MNLAVIGSGGREHAICYKLQQSPKIKKLICIPGNAGTGSLGLECLSRQARSVCFVEKAKETIKILEKNIENLKYLHLYFPLFFVYLHFQVYKTIF